MADIMDLGERFSVSTRSYTPNAPAEQYPMMCQRAKLAKPIDWNHALKRSTDMFNKMTAAMRHPDRAQREQKLGEIAQQFKRKPLPTPPEIAKAIAGGQTPEDIFGKFSADTLIQQLAPAARKLQQAGERAEQRRRNLQLAVALAAYKLDHGSYPKSLDALAPEYLKGIPMDLFSGKSLTYRRTRPATFSTAWASTVATTKEDDDLAVRILAIEVSYRFHLRRSAFIRGRNLRQHPPDSVVHSAPHSRTCAIANPARDDRS